MHQLALASRSQRQYIFFVVGGGAKMKHYILLLGKHHLYYTLDFEESLKIEDLPEANSNEQSKLTQ